MRAIRKVANWILFFYETKIKEHKEKAYMYFSGQKVKSLIYEAGIKPLGGQLTVFMI